MDGVVIGGCNRVVGGAQLLGLVGSFFSRGPTAAVPSMFRHLPVGLLRNPGCVCLQEGRQVRWGGSQPPLPQAFSLGLRRRMGNVWGTRAKPSPRQL